MKNFFVAGTPKPQGSKRAFVNRRTGRAQMVESAGEPLKDWRGIVDLVAIEHGPPVSGPVEVTLTFYLTRPKSHYGTGRNAGTLKPKAPKEHIQKPDIDKLTRAVLDSLSGRLFHDDSQVSTVTAVKVWQPRGMMSGCQISVKQKEE